MMSLQTAAAFAQGALDGADGELLRVVTDSRDIRPGDLFVALKGERFDAHDFVADVLAKGAIAAVVRQDFVLPGATLIRVADTRLALGQLAAGWCASLPLKRIGITGSNGKTTVKEMVASILRRHAGADAVLATAGNFNNDIGVPLTLLQLTAAHRYAVIEMGMNHHGELRYLTGLLRPQVALVNNAMRAHVGHFAHTADVARAKAEIFEGLVADGVAVLNDDDANLAIFEAAAASHTQLRFGLSVGADITARAIELLPLHSRFVLVTPQGEVEVTLPTPGEHNVRNALAATSVALALNVPLTDIAAGLAALPGVKGRLQQKTAAHGVTVIDDTYNANPDSMKAGLEVLSRLPAPRWFVMGDIGELGATAPALHAEVGAYARTLGIDVLLGVGELTGEAVAAFGAGAQKFATQEALQTYLDGHLPAGTSVLVKGSRFMHMERVVDHLTAVTQQNKGI